MSFRVFFKFKDETFNMKKGRYYTISGKAKCLRQKFSVDSHNYKNELDLTCVCIPLSKFPV